MSIHDTVKNGILSSPRAYAVKTNAPDGSGPIGTHWSTETALMYQHIAPFAGNVFEAEIQGLDYDNFYAWTKVKLRSADVFDATTGENFGIDWQKIMIIDRKVDFIPIGAYVRFNKNVWIVYNPVNVSSDVGIAVVQRCNCTYNSLDWYGNVIRTPMAFAKGKILAASPYYMEYSNIMDGYGHYLIQFNDVTKSIHDNTRFILGNTAYVFYGVVNYAQEFTGDDNSVHLIKTDARINEVINIDDMENKVAEGNAFSFDIEIDGVTDINVGGKSQLHASCKRNGETVASTEEHPITLVWESSNEEVATVDDNGLISAVGEGNCIITCSLSQNTGKRSTIEIIVSNEAIEDYVSFTNAIPKSANVFDSFVINSSYFENGTETSDPIQYKFSGVPENAYSVTYGEGNMATIDVWTPTGTLKIEAVHGEHSAVEYVEFRGI